MTLAEIKLTLQRYFTSQPDKDLQSRAFNLINLFRLSLSILFIFSSWYVSDEIWWNNESAKLFQNIAVFYLAFAITILALSYLKANRVLSPVANVIQPIQIVADIFFITLLMNAAGGIQSGIGLLLIVTIVIASLVSNGRLALFYAAIASICLLLEQSYQIVKWDLSIASYTQPAMLSMSCFATAWLAFSLAKRMQHSEDLASARSIDLENLAQVNELITQEMQDGVLVVDQEWNIRHCNLQAQALLTLRNIPDQHLTLNSHAPDIANVFSQWLSNPGSDNHALILSNNRELRLRFMQIKEEKGIGAVIFIQDWSQEQAMAQQTKLAALGRLTANIAHEIRNPLSAISHANQLLQEEENIPAPTARILQIIADNIQRIDQIIKDVLELNRRDRTHQEKIDLQQFLQEFHTHFCAVEKIPANYVQLHLQQQPLYTTFDKRHLQQILWNLCKNGWEHSQRNAGSLGIECTEAGTMGLNIHVYDDGEGVLDKDRARLFEPFFTTKTTGNGLGLYISRELAAANGAILHYHVRNADNKLDNKNAENKNTSSGSVFTIQLKKAQS